METSGKKPTRKTTIELIVCYTVIQPSCWYKNKKYNCGLSLTCALTGTKSLDLCSGGPLWTCCVPQSAIDDNAPTVTQNDASKYNNNTLAWTWRVTTKRQVGVFPLFIFFLPSFLPFFLSFFFFFLFAKKENILFIWKLPLSSYMENDNNNRRANVN